MELRGQAALLTAEVVIGIVCALAPLPFPVIIPLVIVASISLYLRKQTWAERWQSDRLRWGIGALAGLGALILAVVVVGPIVEARTGGMVAWSQHGIVRGKPAMLITVAIVVAATVVATEAVLRGWVLERVRELAPGRRGAVLAVAITALVEATFVGGPGWSGVGAAVFGVALSALYLASGRSLVAPIAARLAFELGNLVLDGLKVVS